MAQQQQEASPSDSLPETLDSPLCVRIDDADPATATAPAASGGCPTASATIPTSLIVTTSSSDPCLTRNVSSSRLNAKAPEFVPRSASSSPSAASTPSTIFTRSDSQSRIVIPPQPPMVHMYSPAAAGPNPPFHHHKTFSPHHHHVPVQYHHHNNHSNHNSNHIHQFYGGGANSVQDVRTAAEVAVQGLQQAHSPPPQGVGDVDHGVVAATPPQPKNCLTEEATQKTLNQVEYYFSDVNLATTDHLIKFISKDPEGYVPLSVVASFKKIKSLVSSNAQLASILQSSTKLAVSEDGKKVRRQIPLTESDMEELQSRIIVAENLPEDHCHQNLMKIFSAVGRVKTIRTCLPQPSNGGASAASRTAKSDGMHYSSKVHAFVEYESVELAEKAVSDLNDEGNWRNGLRVRLMHRRTGKSNQVRVKKGHEVEVHRREDDTSTSEQQGSSEKHFEDVSQPDTQSNENAGEEHTNNKDNGQKKGRGRGRGKGRGRSQYNHNHRGSHGGTPPSNNSVNAEHKQPPGPRMPDGTRGFSMGRGKPVAINIG